MEIPVLVQSLKSSILSSTSFQMGKSFWRVVSAAVEQSRRKATWLLRETGNSVLEARIPGNHFFQFLAAIPPISETWNDGFLGTKKQKIFGRGLAQSQRIFTEAEE